MPDLTSHALEPDPKRPGLKPDPSQAEEIRAALIGEREDWDFRGFLVSAEHPPIVFADDIAKETNYEELIRSRHFALIPQGHLLLGSFGVNFLDSPFYSQ